MSEPSLREKLIHEIAGHYSYGEAADRILGVVADAVEDVIRGQYDPRYEGVFAGHVNDMMAIVEWLRTQAEGKEAQDE